MCIRDRPPGLPRFEAGTAAPRPAAPRKTRNARCCPPAFRASKSRDCCPPAFRAPQDQERP
eukprot:14861818-Alexandrium_andersonii.AAC.1